MSQYTDSTSIKSSHISPAKAHRKIVKPLMEKKRRARINASLNELKSLLVEALHDQGCRHSSKMEKADILEMAVKHLKSLQAQEQLQSSPTYSTLPSTEPSSHVNDYKTNTGPVRCDGGSTADMNNNVPYKIHTNTSAAVAIPYQSFQLLSTTTTNHPDIISTTNAKSLATHNSASTVTHNSMSSSSPRTCSHQKSCSNTLATCQPYSGVTHQTSTAYLATNAKSIGGADLTLILPVNGVQQGTQLPVRLILPFGLCNDTRGSSEGIRPTKSMPEDISTTHNNINRSTSSSINNNSNNSTDCDSLHTTKTGGTNLSLPPANLRLLKPTHSSSSAFHPVILPVMQDQLTNSITTSSQQTNVAKTSSLVWRPW